MTRRSAIHLLTTGGTIEKTYDEREGSLDNRTSTVDTYLKRRLRLYFTDLHLLSVMNKDSLDMDDSDRQLIVAKVCELASKGEPIVVLHGTDTLSQTSKLCAQTCQGLQAPVVFTGAMRPLGFESSDGLQNITEALMAAKLALPGVYVSFHNELYSGDAVRKNPQLLTFQDT